MKISELNKKSRQQLGKMLLDSREKLRGLKFDAAAGRVKNVREIRELRRTIARILTILKQT